jgi:uncharacterized membrane protein
MRVTEAMQTHALIVSAITLSQFYIWGYSRDRQQRLSNPIKAVIVGCLTTTAISVFMVDGEKWQWLDVVRFEFLLFFSLSLLLFLIYGPKSGFLGFFFPISFISSKISSPTYRVAYYEHTMQ